MSSRIVACQGPAQLLSALAVLEKCHEKQSGEGLEDILVIHGLYAGPRLAEITRELAELAWNWGSIHYFSDREISDFARDPKRLQRRLAIEEVAEVYAPRDWLPGNELILSFAPSAKRYCYGDGIGLIFSKAYTTPRRDRWMAKWLSPSRWQKRIRSFWHYEKSYRPIVFDSYYGAFALEEAPQNFISVDRGYFLKVISRWRNFPVLVPDSSERPFILLTSNLSESFRLSRRSEIHAYLQWIDSLALPSRVIWIKPHPRDHKAKIQALAKALANRGFSVGFLNAELPIEVLFERLPRDAVVGVVGSSGLGLAYLFGKHTTLGLGRKLIERYFHRDHVPGRLRFEEDLSKLEQLALGAPA